MGTTTQRNADNQTRNSKMIQAFLREVRDAFARKSFRPHPLFKGSHAQTLAAYAWPRRRKLRPTLDRDEERLFDVENGVQVLAKCRWQNSRQDRGTLAIWHGMEGSVDSVYMWSTADKAFKAGFNVVRINYRNCGDTEHLTPTLYHGGMSHDLHVVLQELVERDRLQRIFLVGFSLGGNMVLKLAGEYGETPPPEIVSICVVSPSVDLQASTDLILKRSNWLYHKNFVRSLKTRIRTKSRFYPDLYDTSGLGEIKTIRDFDENFTSIANGFLNADDYYQRSSAIRVVDKIRIPTLIIHSQDDPFIPFAPFQQESFLENPYLLLIKTDHGGHVAFLSRGEGEDRFWAENRIVEFCQLCDKGLTACEPSSVSRGQG